MKRAGSVNRAGIRTVEEGGDGTYISENGEKRSLSNRHVVVRVSNDLGLVVQEVFAFKGCTVRNERMTDLVELFDALVRGRVGVIRRPQCLSVLGVVCAVGKVLFLSTADELRP